MDERDEHFPQGLNASQSDARSAAGQRQPPSSSEAAPSPEAGASTRLGKWFTQILTGGVSLPTSADAVKDYDDGGDEPDSLSLGFGLTPVGRATSSVTPQTMDMDKAAKIRESRIRKECKMLIGANVEGIRVSSIEVYGSRDYDAANKESNDGHDAQYVETEKVDINKLSSSGGAAVPVGSSLVCRSYSWDLNPSTEGTSESRHAFDSFECLFESCSGSMRKRASCRIMVTVSRDLCRQQDSFPLPPEIIFCFVPHSSFPFFPPHIFCLTKFSFPSVADGRNLVHDILKAEWSPSVTFVSLASKLPQFIDSVTAKVEALQLAGRLQEFRIGNFDGPLRLEQFLSDTSFSVVPCAAFSHEPTPSTSVSPPRCVILTDSVLVCCEVIGSPLEIQKSYNRAPGDRDSSSTCRTHPANGSDSLYIEIDWEVTVIGWGHLGTLERIRVHSHSLSLNFNRHRKSSSGQTPHHYLQSPKLFVRSVNPCALLDAISDHTAALNVHPLIEISEECDAPTTEASKDTQAEPSLVQRVVDFYHEQVEKFASGDTSVINSRVLQFLRDKRELPTAHSLSHPTSPNVGPSKYHSVSIASPTNVQCVSPEASRQAFSAFSSISSPRHVDPASTENIMYTTTEQSDESDNESPTEASSDSVTETRTQCDDNDGVGCSPVYSFKSDIV